MDRLSFATLEKLGYSGYLLKDAPERVVQFGEGNFLRAFADHFIDLMNEKAGFNSKVVLVQPRGGHPEAADRFAEQDGLYTLILRGRENGQPVERKRVISAASRCLDPKRDWEKLLDCARNPVLRFVISNTTEAGIAFDPACKAEDAPPSAFPAKLTVFLRERWKLGLPGVIILSCELIDHNGQELRRCVNEYVKLWALEDEFAAWLEKENIFCSTLVDRIVTGSPKADAPRLWEELGYEDQLIDTGEVFAAWVIEGPQSIRDELPFEQAGLPIQVVDDVTPYKQRKVRILNGAHTSMILGAYLGGKNIVRDCMQNDAIRGFLEKTMFDEIIPTLDLPKKDLSSFAASVIDRFDNPYIDHQLLDIALNSASKWKARVMPSLTEYVKRAGSLP
ncbi:MAG: tagaturonate reductase, partial [Oscillospiraceae bacterium]|nr:tagaturonate reductase [Oscillospiraceae bacterium]